MKSFLTYTAIIEALTGLGLIIVPSKVVLLLLETEINGSLEIILSMVAGAAIFSLALACWFFRLQSGAAIAIRAMLYYNFSLASILLYGALRLGFRGSVLRLVIFYHFFPVGHMHSIHSKEKYCSLK
jgi:hypothetical protein